MSEEIRHTRDSGCAVSGISGPPEEPLLAGECLGLRQFHDLESTVNVSVTASRQTSIHWGPQRTAEALRGKRQATVPKEQTLVW